MRKASSVRKSKDLRNLEETDNSGKNYFFLIQHLRRVRGVLTQLLKKRENEELDGTGCRKQWLQPRTAKKPPKMKPSPLHPESHSAQMSS